MENSSSSMIKLSGTNYSIWKSMMEDHLYCKDLFDPVKLGSKAPDGVSDNDWEKLHRKAVGTIRQWVEFSIYPHISSEVDAQLLWKKLEGMYERKNAQNKASLIRRLVNLKFRDGQSVGSHLSDFQDLVNQLGTMKIVLDDELQALLLLSSLPDSWETLVVSLSNSAPNGVVTLNMVKDSVHNEDIRRKDVGADNTQALVMENRGRSMNRGSKGRSKSRGKSQQKGKFTCYHCGKEGHIKRHCKAFKKDQKGDDNQRKVVDDNTAATISFEEEFVDVSFEEEQCNVVTDYSIEWIVDSGAMNHATPLRDIFSTYRSGKIGRMRMGNESCNDIVGVGDVLVKTDTGCTLTLKNVRHVPGLRLNLMSTDSLDLDGYHTFIGNQRWKLTKGSMVVARGKSVNKLQRTQTRIVDCELNTVEEDASPDMWHKRLAHIGDKGLQVLARKSLIPLAKGTNPNPCDICLLGKQHRVSFSGTSKRKDKVLDLVYSDVCGPIEVESIGGNRYFVTFIDDASRKVWVFVLKTKDQVYQHFKKFHAMVEREKGVSLKCLRSDNGGEYTSKEFEAYCSEHGIRHEKTVPGTPQHNGVAERMNRTIIEKVRCMLKMANLPKSFWGEAVLTASYLINRSPSSPLDNEIPEKVWSGKEVSYAHLKVFGCKAFMHVPKEQRLKLDDKAIQCVFLGYGDTEFGYRLWDQEKKKIVRSRDVVFHESETSSDSEAGKKPSNSTVSNPSLMSPLIVDATGGDVIDEHGIDDEPAPVDNGNDNGDANEEVVEQGEQNPVPEVVEPQLRRSSRGNHPSTKYPSSEYVNLTEEGEPESFQEAETHKDRVHWMEAMREEMNSLEKNDTYELMELPKGKKPLGNKWVFKLKMDGEKLVKYKARLVVKGFNQKQGIDFDEVFSPVVKMTSIRLILGMVASMDLELEQMDVKTAFLHGDLEEEIYMGQPEGFEVKGQEHMVCRLKKSLYGLKQAPRQWYKKFDSFMVGNGYTRTEADHCVYCRILPDGTFIILLLYVDDMLIVGHDAKLISGLKDELSNAFEMKDLGQARQILGMHIVRDRKTKKLWLSQESYVERILDRFNMKNAKPVSTPLANHFKLSKKNCPSTDVEKKEMAGIPYSSAVGSLMYAMVCTRPDIAQAVGVVSRFLSNPGKEHWEAVKWIFRYLRGSSRKCLCFGDSKPILEGFTDSDMAGDLDGRKSTSGYVFTFAGGAVSWQSKLQKCVALSTTEAEYIAATEACKELLWLKRFLHELGLKQDEYVVYCDSQSATDLSKNATYHGRTKHIDVRYHSLREVICMKDIFLKKVHTSENTADMLTRTVTRDKYELCAKAAGLSSKLC